MRALSAVLLAAFAASAFGTYTWYFTDPMQSLQTSHWTSSGSPQFTNANGYWGAYSGTSSGYSSMVSTVAVPDGTSSYGVQATLRFPNSGDISGDMNLLLRASSTFNSTGPYAAMPTTAYAVNFFCGGTEGWVSISKIVNGVGTSLASTSAASCSDGMTVRAGITDNGSIYAFVNETYVTQAQDTSITSGAPGIVLPGNNSQLMLVSQVQLGPADRIAPGPIPTNGLTYAAYSSHIDFQWQAVPDDPNGTGVLFYQFLRNNQWAQNTEGLSWSDTTVQPGTEYSYTFQVLDYFFNTVTMTVNITTPVTPGATPTPIDGQRIGVRPTGAYWGASPEQIDVLSGNVNWAIPLLTAQARTGWSVPFNAVYNSQNWRLDSGGTWNLGEDVGYGYGWKLLAGSLTPIWANQYTFSYYSFVDASGAQYRLDQNNSGIWSSVESIYVTYNANTNTLYFRDGSFWVMLCTSATSEPDAGTMYPTTMEDTNGNQILITYQAGAGLGGSNSSARITLIQDVRSGVTDSYNFSYLGSPAHLVSITNSLGTAENYTFSYATNYLGSPFSNLNFQSTQFLASIVSSLNTPYEFGYLNNSNGSSSGEIQTVVLPTGGWIYYNYDTVTYPTSTNPSFREVASRVLSKDGTGNTAVTYGFYHESTPQMGGATPGPGVHVYTIIPDPGGVGEKYWKFSQSSANMGMVTRFQGCTQGSASGQDCMLNGATPLSQNDFTWSQDSAGDLYISSTLTTLNPGSGQVQKKTDQNVDIHGNVTNVFQFDFGNLTTPARIYTYTYLNSTAYTSRYIYNRMTQATLSVGQQNLVTLATNTYDSGTFATAPSGVPYWDQSYAGVTARGDVTSYTSINDVGSMTYDQIGNVTTKTLNGVMTQVTTTSTTNYAVPSQLSVGSLTSSMDWSSFLGLTNATGPNGDSVATSFDSAARPATTTSPYGAVTNYVYSSGPYSATAPATTTATTNGHKIITTLDGLGRTLTVQTGDTSGIKSQVDTVYGPCACSPIGKMIQQSLPHAPNASQAWTTYTYDGIGRAVSIVAPDGHSTTTYSYQGNTVTVTDPAGKTKTFTMDAFGHLTQVSEPNPAGGSNYITTYAYDAWDNLSQVSMPRPSGTQTRTFTYNGKLLLSATNPENGTVTYTYNGYNKVATKTDAKGQAVKYTYDGYARLTEVQRYPQGLSGNEDTSQQEDYYYDNSYNSSYPNYSLGRLTAVQYYGGFGTTFTETYGYNQAGQKTNKGLLVTRSFTAQNNNGDNITGPATADLESTYTYDYEGRMTSIQYPGSTGGSGPNFGYGYDTMGRLSTMTGLSGTGSISATYDVANRLIGLTGNLTESRTYNVMGQLTNITSTAYGYPGGNLNITYNYSSTQNNGKIASQTDNISGEQVVYTYDALNRLASAGATSGSWGQSYSYDGFGNLTNQTVTAGTAPTLSVVYSASTNRQTTDCADANGNVNSAFACGSSGYIYDVENRLQPPSLYGVGSFYSYAPGNKRVWRGAINNSSAITLDEITFWDASGQKLATYNLIQTANASTTVLDAGLATVNTYFGGRLIANVTGNVVTDRLGSIGKYYPWGQEKPSATTNGTEKFTGYFRDAETGLDYADQRYHQPGMGRFMAVDPYKSSAGPRDPGSWNRYAYAGGDPVNRKDPSGQDWCDADDYGDECLLPSNPYGWDINDQILASLAGIATALAAELSGLATEDGPSCTDVLTFQIGAYLQGTPLAAFASLFVSDAEADGIDPRLLVAIAGAESQLDTASNLKKINDPFGITKPKKTKKGTIYVPRSFDTLQDAIGFATDLASSKIDGGFNTVSKLYSGKRGGWCVDRPGHPGECLANGGANATSIINQFGGNASVGLKAGNPNNLAFPCPENDE